MSEQCKEYLRRNLMHAKSVGANAGVKVALSRLTKLQRQPKWLILQLIAILDRIEPLPSEIAQWRDSADDAPSYAKRKTKVKP